MTMPAPSRTGTAGATPQSPASTPTASGSAGPSTQTMSFVPYFTAGQLEMLYARQRGSRLSESKWQSNRNVATGFVQAVASRLFFPQRTAATAQILYQRFHLFFPPSDFVLHEVALACLFLSSKLNDTPKKARDILLASYALRFPELVKGDSESSKTGEVSSAETNGEGAGTKRKEPSSDSNPFPPFRGSVTDSDIDASVLETDRKRLMALEKLLLESICFNFELRAQTALRLVIKVGRMWQLPKALCHAAWRVAADLHRTTAPLQYPSKVIAVASYYAVALLMEPPPSQLDGSVSASYPLDPQDAVQDQTRAAAREVIAKLAKAGRPDSSTSTSGSGSGVGSCEEVLGIHIEDVEEAVHELLDLYLAQTSALPSLDGQQHSRRKVAPHDFSPPPFGLVDWAFSTPSQIPRLPSLLTDMKIYLRGIEYERQKQDASSSHPRVIRRRTVTTARLAFSEPTTQLTPTNTPRTAVRYLF